MPYSIPLAYNLSEDTHNIFITESEKSSTSSMKTGDICPFPHPDQTVSTKTYMTLFNGFSHTFSQQDRGQSPVKTPRPELNPTIFSVPKPKIAFWPLFGLFLAQVGQNRHKNIFSLSWDQMISNEGSHAYVWTKLWKLIYSVSKWLVGPFLAPFSAYLSRDLGVPPPSRDPPGGVPPLRAPRGPPSRGGYPPPP